MQIVCPIRSFWSIPRALKWNDEYNGSTLKWNVISTTARHRGHTHPLLAFGKLPGDPEIVDLNLRRDGRAPTAICLCFRTDHTVDVAICCHLLLRQDVSPHVSHEIVHESDTDRWGRSPPFIVSLGPNIALSNLTGFFTNWIRCFCHLHFGLANGTIAGRDFFAGEYLGFVSLQS
jgi:hypothetical protein